MSESRPNWLAFLILAVFCRLLLSPAPESSGKIASSDSGVHTLKQGIEMLATGVPVALVEGKTNESKHLNGQPKLVLPSRAELASSRRRTTVQPARQDNLNHISVPLWLLHCALLL